MSSRGNIRDTAAELDDGWIWGSSRGGGGAPLKDKSGKAITNLKLVIQGDVEPDHSPSHSPNKDPFAVQGGGGRGGGYDDDEYDDTPRGQYRRSNGRTPRGGGYDDDYDDMPRNNRGGEKPRRLRFQDDGGDDYEQDIYGSGGDRRGAGSGRRNTPRRNDDYNDYDEPRTSRNNVKRGNPNRHTSPIDRGSPNGKGKPIGQAIREMYKSELPEHREIRTKKELNYQNELKAQIEEKQRKKDLDQLKQDQLKQKELEEYLTVHYKGSVPSHVSSKVRKTRQELQERERKLNRSSEGGYDNEFGSSFAGGGRGGGSKGGKSLVLDDIVGGQGGGRGARPGRRAPRDYSPEDDRDAAFDDPPMAPRRSPARSPGNRRAPRDFEDDEASMPTSARDKSFHKKWVPQSEYDELSALCDNLLRQQDELQSELGEVKSARGSVRGGPAAARRGVANTNARARSQQQLHREQARPKQNGPGTFGSSRTRSSQSTRSNNAGVSAREARESARGGSAANTAKKGGGKVAFGRAIVPSAPSKRQEPVSKGGGVANMRGGGGGSVGGRGMPASRNVPPLSKSNLRNAPRGGRRPMDDEDYDMLPAGPRGGGGGGGGFQRLAQKTKVKGEPVVVSYDDEGQGPPPGPRGGGRGRASVELNGESEYLKIGGEEVDIISGDQLDRLLVQARRARASDY